MELQIASGTHIGIAHVNSGKNNQDAHVIKRFSKGLVAVICDGCSEGAHSEVGAWTAAELLAQAISQQTVRALAGGKTVLPETFWRRVLDDTLAMIRVQALNMAGNASFTEVVMNYFLFTIVGALVTEKTTWIFSVGDGVYALNGEFFELPHFAENEPPYPAFQLIGSKFDTTPEMLRIQVQRTIPTAEIKTLLIGSDGLCELVKNEGNSLPGRNEKIGPLSQFWEVDRFFKMSVAVRQRLALVNSPVYSVSDKKLHCFPGIVQDDMTLISLRFREGNLTQADTNQEGEAQSAEPQTAADRDQKGGPWWKLSLFTAGKSG